MTRLPFLFALLLLPVCGLLAQTIPAPIAYYPFNSSFRDESGNTRDATGEDVGFTSDNRGNALAAAYFNNQTSLVSALTVNSGQDEYTFSGLILPYTNSQYTTLLYIGTNSAANGIGIALKGAGTQAPGNNIVVFAGGLFETRDTSVRIDAFKWQHFVLVKHLDTVKMYVNGQKIFGETIPNNPSTSPLYIGTSASHRQAHRRSFNGVMDEVKFFNVALADSQVVSLFNQDYSTISQSVGILRGNLYLDTDRDCMRDSTEAGLGSGSAVVEPGGLVVPLSAYGTFSVPVSSGTYTARLQPTRFFQTDSLCTSGPAMVSAGDSATMSMGVQGRACSYLNVSMGIQARRRCFETSSSVHVQNLGMGTSDTSARLTVEYPKLIWARSFSPIQPISSTVLPDSTIQYVFALPALAAGGSFVLRARDSTVCRDSLMGLMVCSRASVTDGASACPAQTLGWDGSNLEARALCDPDSAGSILLSVKNTGWGSTRQPARIRLFAGDGIAATYSRLFAAGDSAVYRVRDEGDLWAITAGQSQYHPFSGFAVAAWGGCLDTVPVSSRELDDLLARLDLGDESPSLDIDCMPIVDSYDPNDKLVTPSGIGPEHIVAPKTRLEYKIRFQNKGTASTVFVTVRDTLSADLDVASFERGAESHPGAEVSTYKFGERYILQWRFASLELTPEAVNDPGSQGFVTFRISPREDLPLGTDVANKAGIFFDYNRPVVTAPVKVRYDNLPATTVPNPVVEPVSAKKRASASRMNLSPNPARGSVYLSLKGAVATENMAYILRDVIGREVTRGAVPAKGGSISLAALHRGIYMITLKAGNASETRKLIVE